jgi:hypothetical protein
MSVTVLDHYETIKSNNSCPMSPVFRNFFEAFNTTGCLLDCEARRNDEAKSYSRTVRSISQSRAEKRIMLRESKHRLKKENAAKWFTTIEIAASANQGCESCQIFENIIGRLFPEERHEILNQYEHQISAEFVIRRRIQNKQNSVEAIQLFQDRGTTPNPAKARADTKSWQTPMCCLNIFPGQM